MIYSNTPDVKNFIIGDINYYNYNIPVYSIPVKSDLIKDYLMFIHLNWVEIPRELIKNNHNPFIYLTQLRNIFTDYLNKFFPRYISFIHADFLLNIQKTKLQSIYTQFLSKDKNLKYKYNLLTDVGNNIIYTTNENIIVGSKIKT